MSKKNTKRNASNGKDNDKQRKTRRTQKKDPAKTSSKKKSSPTTAKPVKKPRDKFKQKGVRGVLVNLELSVAEQFYRLSKSLGSNPTAKARELIETFLAENQQKPASNNE